MTTGIADSDLAAFWGRALKRMHKLGLSDVERHDVARQLVRKGVPMPEHPTWPGAGESHWADVLGELTSLIEDIRVASAD